MLFPEGVWKRLFVDFGALRGCMLSSLGVLFGVWIDAGNCLEFQWIFGISQDPPKVNAGQKWKVIWGESGALTANQKTADQQTADCRSAD